MRKIYFNSNVVTITTNSLDTNDADVVYSNPIDITKVLQNLENNKSLAIIGENIEEIYSEFCSFFRQVDAAGGVVMRNDGYFLMMHRNGKWDLPKGHREIGEEIEQCALREVEEECGVSELTLVKPITVTEHIYPLKGEWVLKSTYWYQMMSKDIRNMTPQIEEGIDELRWVSKQDAELLLKNSYSTIRDVLSEIALV